MLEVVISIILLPIALAATVFSGAIVVGTVQYIKKSKKNNEEV